MHCDNVLVTFEREDSHVRAWISASSSPPAASAQDHRYATLTAALRQRGLECTVEYGLSDYIVHTELPDGSSLIISPPQEPPSETPESWMATRHRSAEPAVYEVVYDSEPDGPDARNGGSVPHLLSAVDTRLDRLGVPMRQDRGPSAEEHAADAVLHRAGFAPAVAVGGAHYYRLPSAMTDPAEQRLAVTRAYDMLQAEGFRAQMQTGRTFPPASASSRVSAALAPSPAAGQHALPACPPTNAPVPAALPPTRPSSTPGR
ncbi:MULTISPECIES: hypothetical protein [unclassified Streptomyces]|uniref:hypothetical protein n=1 Tax=unclassified Streptomyces TaxID=2593676 RepID=UPI002E0D2386|nr:MULTISPECIES: hypothetical protein [unclassified Streptomyces]WSR09850.1 hypothetical protein OG265_29245 [Streptomyces sp. NBC_01208]WSR47426.1 hypothetical protein OG279_07255 [Streptomyces sp. NBC_01201]